MTCNNKCIHYPVCEQKNYDFANIEECPYYYDTPTVEITETEIQEVLNKRCMTAVANEYLVALHGKRPQGEWIDLINTSEPKACNFCSICREFVLSTQYNFCPNCGADMRGGAE